MRSVIFNSKPYDSIADLARSLGLEDKTVWNHLARGSEVADTQECVDYRIEPGDWDKFKDRIERNNKLN